MSRALKIEAARAALEWVHDGMKLGIGTGSTADEFTRLLGKKVADGFQITGIPTSENTRMLCEELSIPLSTLDKTPRLDMVIDGADEVDRNLQLIKGGGGALLREKIVAHASDKMVVIADDSKQVETLGAFPLPLEVNPFGLAATRLAIEIVLANLGFGNATLELRGGTQNPFTTDGGHFILDANLGAIPDGAMLSRQVLDIPGVVEHGLFLGYATHVFLAGADGVRQLSRDG